MNMSSTEIPFFKTLLLSLALVSCGVSANRSELSADSVPFDSDGDGVGPLLDRCPSTDPADFPVDASGCSTKDSDGDSVPDERDKDCPATPKGETVNLNSGCMTHYYFVSLIVVDGSIETGLTEQRVKITREMTKETAQALLVAETEDYIAGSSKHIENVEAQRLPLPEQDDSTCRFYNCSAPTASSGGPLGGGSGNDFSAGNTGAGAPATPTPPPGGFPVEPVDPDETAPVLDGSNNEARSPVIVVGGSLTGIVDVEQFNQEMLGLGYQTTAANSSAPALLRTAKALGALSSSNSANLLAPQASKIASSLNQISSVSLRIADEMFTKNENGEGGAYLYTASVLVDAVYELANTDLASRLGSSEEVPSLYRNLYETFSGMSYQGELVLSEKERAQALLAIVNSPVGDMMLAPGTQAQKVSSFGILFKKIQMQITGDETSIDALIEAAKTI